MTRWHTTTRLYSIAAVLVVAVLALGATATLPGATAQTDLTVGSLDVSGANDTVDSNVTDVRLSTDLNYDHDVTDAERRIIKLKIGPSTDALETLTYKSEPDTADAASGTVTLGGSLTDHSAWTADDFNPADGGEVSKEVVVRAVLEVPRAGGDTATATVTDTATVTVTDAGTVEVAIGGTGGLTIETS